MSGELDMTRAEDRATLRRAIAKNWPVSREKLLKYSDALDQALEIALERGSSRDTNQVVRTMVAIVSQIQADEHLDEKHDRIDNGKTAADQPVLKFEIVERTERGDHEA